MTNTCDIMQSRKERVKLFNPFSLWTVASYVYLLKDQLLLFFPLFLILKVRGSSEESYKLDKPHSELMRYDVHPNALTQSGNYHFSGKNKFVMTQPLSGWLCCSRVWQIKMPATCNQVCQFWIYIYFFQKLPHANMPPLLFSPRLHAKFLPSPRKNQTGACYTGFNCRSFKVIGLCWLVLRP